MVSQTSGISDSGEVGPRYEAEGQLRVKVPLENGKVLTVWVKNGEGAHGRLDSAIESAKKLDKVYKFGTDTNKISWKNNSGSIELHRETMQQKPITEEFEISKLSEIKSTNLDKYIAISSLAAKTTAVAQPVFSSLSRPPPTRTTMLSGAYVSPSGPSGPSQTEINKFSKAVHLDEVPGQVTVNRSGKKTQYFFKQQDGSWVNRRGKLRKDVVFKNLKALKASVQKSGTSYEECWNDPKEVGHMMKKEDKNRFHMMENKDKLLVFHGGHKRPQVWTKGDDGRFRFGALPTAGRTTEEVFEHINKDTNSFTVKLPVDPDRLPDSLVSLNPGPTIQAGYGRAGVGSSYPSAAQSSKEGVYSRMPPDRRALAEAQQNQFSPQPAAAYAQSAGIVGRVQFYGGGVEEGAGYLPAGRQPVYPGYPGFQGAVSYGSTAAAAGQRSQSYVAALDSGNADVGLVGAGYPSQSGVGAAYAAASLGSPPSGQYQSSPLGDRSYLPSW